MLTNKIQLLNEIDGLEKEHFKTKRELKRLRKDEDCDTEDEEDYKKRLGDLENSISVKKALIEKIEVKENEKANNNS